MEALGKDIRHAWRMFRENKLFTATAIAALTLGIAVNIAIFSVVNAVLLKPVPFPDADALVQLTIRSSRRKRGSWRRLRRIATATP
jgi:putative ABC transport system permease protein